MTSHDLRFSFPYVYQDGHTSRCCLYLLLTRTTITIISASPIIIALTSILESHIVTGKACTANERVLSNLVFCAQNDLGERVGTYMAPLSSVPGALELALPPRGSLRVDVGRLCLPVLVSHSACRHVAWDSHLPRATWPPDAQAAGRSLNISSTPTRRFIDMSRVAKFTLATAVLASAATVWTVHYMQRREREACAHVAAADWCT